MLDATVGWRARLAVHLEQREGRTRFRALAHEGPLRVQRLFHPEGDGTAHVYILHPPGGVAAGDSLEIDASVAREGAALLTTPGATKVYRSNGRTAAIRTVLTVAGGATLEHTPQETIVFDGARASLSLQVRLERGARFLGWEVLCLGRPACRERFERGALRMALEILGPTGRPLLIERGTLDGGAIAHGAYGLGGHAALGTLVATEGDLDALRASLAAAPRAVGVVAGATRVAGLVVIRALAPDAGAIRRAFEGARHHVRSSWGRAPNDPAVWRT